MSESNREIPVWSSAARHAHEQYRPGDIIPMAWLFDRFGLDMPRPDTPYEVARHANVDFVHTFKRFEKVLIEEYLWHPQNIPGVGYRIIPAQEQIGWAETKHRHDLRKALGKQSNRLNYIDLKALGAVERRQREDALARQGQLLVLFKSSGLRRYKLAEEA